MRRITLITTGGTMEKEYDERSGTLVNRRSVVDQMLRGLRLEDTVIAPMELLQKDSLDISESDRELIVHAVRNSAEGQSDGIQRAVVIVHGTDTLEKTGEKIYAEIPDPACPIVITGAMRPYELSKSDAVQNLTEAIFATSVLPNGVYCVAHGRALAFPGVIKDRTRGTFVKNSRN